MPQDTSRIDLLKGTLDLLVMRTLQALGPQHGYGIARRIEQVSANALLINQGTVYASLLRLQQHGWIEAEWGTSGNNRRAKFYRLTASGRRQVRVETTYWRSLNVVVERVLCVTPGDGDV